MLVVLFLSVVGAQLANDLCSGAINVTDGQHTGSNVGVPVPSYAQRADCLYTSDVYYVYHATCTGKVAISALGDTTSGLRLAAFAGNCAGLGPCVSDYSGSTSPASIEVYSSAVGDKIYFGFGSSSAPDTFSFNITCSGQGVAAGDRCPNALPYTPNMTVSTTNASTAQQSASPPSCFGSDIFILYNATCDGDATVTVASSGSNDLAVFYPGTCDQIVGADYQRECTTSPSSGFPVQENRLYYIAVGGSTDTEYTVEITCVASARPVNDVCGGAISVTSPFTFDTSTATRSVPPDVCGSFDSDVWVSYDATCDGDLWLQFNGSTDAVAYIGSACDGVLASGCIDDEYAFTFPVSMGQTYRIALASGSSAVIEANFTCMAQTRPTNDKCVNATPTGTNVSYVIDPRTATTESTARALSCDRRLVNDIFYQYTTCAGDNTIYVDYNGSITDVTLAAYLGCGLEPVACVNSYTTSFAVPYAVPVLIAVGFGNSGGYARVDFSCTPTPTDAPTDAPTPQPTAPTTPQPTPAPTTATPTKVPTEADNTTDTAAPTEADNTTDTAAPTLSGAKTLQLGLASLLLGFAMLA